MAWATTGWTFNNSSGLVAIANGITYDGGDGSDSLRLLGSTAVDNDIYNVGSEIGSGNDVQTLGLVKQTVFFKNIEPMIDLVTSTLVVNATNADNAINYKVGPNTNTALVGGIGVNSGQVSVDGFEPVEFANKTTLTINGLSGSDEINLNNSSAPSGLTGITVNGGDPTASDTLIVNGTAATVAVDVSAQTITGVAGTGVTVTYGTIEHLTVVAGVSTTLSVAGSSSAVGVNYTLSPGTAADRGDITTIGVPISFVGYDTGKTLNFVGDTQDGDDVLTILGTSLNDSFSVAGVTGAVTYTGRAAITQTNMDELVIDGLDGDDQFTVAGNHPYFSVAIHGNNPSASDVLNFNASGAGLVTADLAAQTIAETGFNSVGFTGIEIINANANSQNLSIKTTVGDDELAVTPSGANAVSAQRNSSVPGIDSSPLINGSDIATFNVDMLGGNDQLTVNGTQIGETITINGTLVTVGSLETVNYANTEHLHVNGLAGNDTFNVTPSANTTIFVNGGDPIGVLPGDQIQYLWRRTGDIFRRAAKGPGRLPGGIERHGQFCAHRDNRLDRRPGSRTDCGH